MRNALAGLVTLATLVAFGGSVLAQQKYTSAIKVKKGATLRFVETTETSTSMDMGGTPMDATNVIHQELTFVAESIAENGDVTFKVSIGRVHGRMESPMTGEIEFDSSKEEDDSGMGPMRGPILAISGKSLTMLVGANGEIKKLEGKELEKALAGMGGGMMGGGMTLDAMKQRFDQMFPQLPEGGAALGQSWDYSETGRQFGVKTTIKGKRTLAEVTDDELVIKFDGKLDIDAANSDAGGNAEMQEALSSVDVSNGTLTATYRISRRDGIIRRAAVKRSVEMAMPMPAGGEGGTMDMTITSSSTVERVDAFPKKTADADSKEKGGNGDK